MDNEWNKFNRSRARQKVKRGRKQAFIPDRDFCEKAMDIYLKNGGRITVLDKEQMTRAELAPAYGSDAHCFFTSQY